ncbi:MAG: serine/threonine protein phosphatase [Roseovarius sp.]|nr:serine/threonine protein phosphatase [Roseovarius sp.]MBK46057.1 serine/threonine protein phosphatase [Roseovarius sp.]|tara:strand:- start:924 stop:1694 length:771 start_codon:yes stop_codon:yes gene_type:complete
MTPLLSRFLPGRARRARGQAPAPIRPDQAFVAIGDVHGRSDLLFAIDEPLERQAGGLPVVFVGDYVDRGEQSREVLQLLMQATAQDPQRVTCLMGNHERMLLDVLDAPETHGARWLRNGGLQTLASFGVAPPQGPKNELDALLDMRAALAEAMGRAMIDWLRARPLAWQSGNVWVVHAGADPAQPMTQQAEEVLLWGHPRFRRELRADGQWVIHGHTIVETPQARDGRIAIDTGAYATGRLTAALVDPDGVRFLQT